MRKPIFSYSARARVLPSMNSSSNIISPRRREASIISRNMAVPMPSPQYAFRSPMATVPRWAVFIRVWKSTWQQPATRPSTSHTRNRQFSSWVMRSMKAASLSTVMP